MSPILGSNPVRRTYGASDMTRPRRLFGGTLDFVATSTLSNVSSSMGMPGDLLSQNWCHPHEGFGKEIMSLTKEKNLVTKIFVK